MSGTCPALGCGDPAAAVPLYTTPQKYPLWANKEPVFIPGMPNSGSYRYCIFSGGVFKRWEGDENELIRRQFQDGAPGADGSGSGSLEIVTADVLGEVAPPRPPGAGPAAAPAINKSKTFYRQQVNAWMHKSTSQNISQMDGVIIVAFFLPVIIEKSSSGEWKVKWDTENLLSFQTSLRVSWIGLVRHRDILTSGDKREITELLNARRCYPIYIDEGRYNLFYNVFCKQILWPVLHHVAGVYAPTIIQDSEETEADVWRNYMLVRTNGVI